MSSLFFSQNVQHGYSLLFNVTSDNFPLFQGVNVNFNGINYTTDVNGQVFIKNIAIGDYNYIVTAPSSNLVKNQFMLVSDSVNINSNKIVDIKLINGYGYLYNSYVVRTPNFIPTDFAVPSFVQRDVLLNYLQGSYSGTELKEIGSTHWSYKNTGTNITNFSMFGSGERDVAGAFYSMKYQGYFYLSSYTSGYSNLYVQMNHDNSNSSTAHQINGESGGRSVRLVYTGTGTPTTVTDYDGNVYDVVQIGTQYWTKQNWKCTRLNDGTLIPNVTDNTAWSNLTTMARCAYDNDENNV